MDKVLEEQVRTRAGDACEYCRLPQAASRIRFPVDHVTARQHGGATEPGNLALCCGRCNRYKGPNVAGIDPLTGRLTRLFNPRRDRWNRHFEWRDALLVGRTAVGRTTIAVLNVNHPLNVAVREQLLREGTFPGR
jgi:hypothetical protein